MTSLLVFPMDFPQRLASLRKARGLTQKALAEQVGLQVLQIHRYEAGSSQPTLEVIRRLALALNITSDELVFGAEERTPDQALLLQFEAVKRLDPDEKHLVKELIEGMLLKHEAKRWMLTSAEPVSAGPSEQRSHSKRTRPRAARRARA